MPRPYRDFLQPVPGILREAGRDDLAAGVEAILAPKGWTLLQPRPGEATEATSPLSITTTDELRGALRSAASELGWVLSEVAADGYRRVLDGSWLPPKRVDKRSVAGAARKAKRATMSIDVPVDLREKVQARLEELSERAGYRVSEGSIALLWMADELGVETPVPGEPVRLRVMKPLADHLRAAAEREGTTLEQVADEGIRALLGGWLPPRPSRQVGGAGREDATWLPVRVDADLLADLVDVIPSVSERLEYRMFPGSIVLAILKNRLGEPE